MNGWVDVCLDARIDRWMNLSTYVSIYILTWMYPQIYLPVCPQYLQVLVIDVWNFGLIFPYYPLH